MMAVGTEIGMHSTQDKATVAPDSRKRLLESSYAEAQ